MCHRIGVVVCLAIGCLIWAGCEAQRVSNVDPNARAAIGYAATAHYPGNAMNSTANVLVGALDRPGEKRIELLNLSDNAVPDAKVWVNGAYVRQIGTLPPRGTTSVDYSGMLQAGQTAMDFARAEQAVTKVEIETGNVLYRVLGPAVKR